MFDVLRRSVIVSALAVLLSGSVIHSAMAATPANEPAADLVILHGHVYSADGSGRFAEAVAVRDGKVLAVGSDANIAAMAGPKTEIVDAAGGAVTPGLIDTHVHFMMGAETLEQFNLSGARTGAEVSERVANYAAAHPDQAWLVGFGYFPDSVTRADLDRGSGDRPAMVRAGDGHSMLANSRALALAGITRDTPDPTGGRIVRDASGEPTGHLLETAQLLLVPVIPKATMADKRRFLDEATQVAHEAGLTTIVNVGGTDDLALFDAARADGKLGIRIAMALWLTSDSATNELPASFDFTPADADRFDAIRAQFHSDDRLKLDRVKIMLDGVIESHTAAMLQPYSDDPTTSGHANYTPEELGRVITLMDAHGWNVMTHALGDRAVRMALDAYRDAAAANPQQVGKLRHKIEHIESIDPTDVPRFGALGVTASIQPAHAGGMNDPQMRGERWTNIGYERSAWGWPWKSIKQAGGRLAFGSDWPVASLNIGRAMQIAVSRIPHPPVPDQKLTVAEVIDGYTRDAAWSIGVDQDRGTLAPGKLADIVIFRDDIFTKPLTGDDLAIAATLMDGKVVYRGDAPAE